MDASEYELYYHNKDDKENNLIKVHLSGFMYELSNLKQYEIEEGTRGEYGEFTKKHSYLQSEVKKILGQVKYAVVESAEYNLDEKVITHLMLS